MSNAPPLDLSTLAGRVAYLQHHSGLDRVALSLRAGVSQAVVGMLMRGNVKDPVASTVSGLARVTGTSTDWIIDGKGPPPDPATVAATVAATGDRPLATGTAG